MARTYRKKTSPFGGKKDCEKLTGRLSRALSIYCEVFAQGRGLNALNETERWQRKRLAEYRDHLVRVRTGEVTAEDDPREGLFVYIPQEWPRTEEGCEEKLTEMEERVRCREEESARKAKEYRDLMQELKEYVSVSSDANRRAREQLKRPFPVTYYMDDISCWNRVVKDWGK